MKDQIPFPPPHQPAEEGSDLEETMLLPNPLCLGNLPPALVNRHRADAQHTRGQGRAQKDSLPGQEQSASAPNGSRQRSGGQAGAEGMSGEGPKREQPGNGSQWKKRRLLISGGTIALLVILGSSAFMMWKKAAPPSQVTLYKVGAPHEIPLPIGGGGITYPKQQITLSYPAAERIVSVMVNTGDHVKVNQSLVQLDASQLNAEVQQAESDMEAASTYLNSVAVSGTSANIAAAQQAYTIAQNKYNAMVTQASSPLYHNGTIVAPMSGVVTEITANAGSVVPANSSLLTIMDESTDFVHIKVPLANLGQIQRGQKATVTPAALADLHLSGTVSNIIPQADPQTDTFEVWISVENPQGILLPGMSAFARIQSMTKALSVPRLAVLYASSDAAVYVVRNQVAHLQSVQVIGRDVDTIYIGEGLQANDQVVLVGMDSVQNGQPVQVSHIEGP